MNIQMRTMVCFWALMSAAVSAAAVASPSTDAQPSVGNTIDAGRQFIGTDPTFNRRDFSILPGGSHPGGSHPGGSHPADYSFKTSGSLSLIDTGVIFWTVSVLLGLAVAAWIYSLCTGASLFKIGSVINGRAADLGFDLNQQLTKERFNTLATKVYEAIDHWRSRQHEF